MKFSDLPAHTVQCYRNSTKCKVCNEIIFKDKKKIHLARWRDQDKLKQSVIEDHEELVSKHFDHGMDCNMEFNFEKSPGLKKMSESMSKIPIPDANN